MRSEGRRGGPLKALPATCPEKGPHMCRKPLVRFVIAAVLVLGPSLPAAAASRGPVPATASRPGWGILPGGLWDLLLQLFGPAPRLKNGIQIDPDGATAAPVPLRSDNGIQIDPNG